MLLLRKRAGEQFQALSGLVDRKMSAQSASVSTDRTTAVSEQQDTEMEKKKERTSAVQ